MFYLSPFDFAQGDKKKCAWGIEKDNIVLDVDKDDNALGEKI
jgi:hypothetical protein